MAAPATSLPAPSPKQEEARRVMRRAQSLFLAKAAAICQYRLVIDELEGPEVTNNMFAAAGCPLFSQKQLPPYDFTKDGKFGLFKEELERMLDENDQPMLARQISFVAMGYQFKGRVIDSRLLRLAPWRSPDHGLYVDFVRATMEGLCQVARAASAHALFSPSSHLVVSFTLLQAYDTEAELGSRKLPFCNNRFQSYSPDVVRTQLWPSLLAHEGGLETAGRQGSLELLEYFKNNIWGFGGDLMGHKVVSHCIVGGGRGVDSFYPAFELGGNAGPMGGPGTRAFYDFGERPLCAQALPSSTFAHTLFLP